MRTPTVLGSALAGGLLLTAGLVAAQNRVEGAGPSFEEQWNAHYDAIDVGIPSGQVETIASVGSNADDRTALCFARPEEASMDCDSIQVDIPTELAEEMLRIRGDDGMSILCIADLEKQVARCNVPRSDAEWKGTPF